MVLGKIPVLTLAQLPKRFVCALLAFFMMSSYAQTHPYGAVLSLPIWSKEPTHVGGFQFMLNYHPCSLIWNHWSLYFDGGFSRFTADSSYHSTLNIYSAAPVLRYTLNRYAWFKPYLELSIGLSYLNHTRFEDRKLGIHFAFQDRVGVGALLGCAERFSLGLHAVHYSNARLSGHNSGITIPVVLDMGYSF